MANSHDWCLSREHETPAAHDSDDAASIVLGRRHVLDSMTRTVRLIAGRRGRPILSGRLDWAVALQQLLGTLSLLNSCHESDVPSLGAALQHVGAFP